MMETSPHANVGIVTGEVYGIIVIDTTQKKACETFTKTYPESTATLQERNRKEASTFISSGLLDRDKAWSTALGAGWTFEATADIS